MTYQYPGGQPYGMPYFPPPRKSRTGLWVGLSLSGLLVVGLTVLAITGFVAPGFFLDRDIPVDAARNIDSRTMAGQFVDALNAKDTTDAYQLMCETNVDQLRTKTSEALYGNSAGTNFRVDKVSPDSATVTAELTYRGHERERHGALTLHRGPDDGYCAFDLQIERIPARR